MNALPVNDPAKLAELTLGGNCSYQVEDGRIAITIGEIANNRDIDNLSGTLAIEIWAFAQPYQGGEPEGEALASTVIGEVKGQHFLSHCHYDLIFREPDVGIWHLALLLREWDAEGYVTRHAINFEQPYEKPAQPHVTRSEDSKVITVDFGDGHKSEPKPDAKKTSTAKTDASPERLSINAASAEEIARLKGISIKTAENIVAARPFDTLDALLKVKGIGKKLLDNLQKLITL